MERYAFSFGVALASSLVLTLVVRTVARRLGLIAKPRADRWHRRPTALFGGVAFYMAFLISYLARRPSAVEGDALLVVCGSAMFLLGLIDDRVQLKPYTKLVGQIIVATAFTTFGLRLHWLPSQVLDQALSIFWLIGITNAVNLLDNLDGLASGVAMIAAAYLVYFSHIGGAVSAASLAAALCGAVLGFLVFNFNPASIFMGDCGSLFLGFTLAGMVMVNAQKGTGRNVLAVLTIPVLLLAIPILDTTLVTISRSLNGRRVSQGGRDHTSHRLVALGMSERAAALTLWSLAALSGALAVVVQQLSSTMGAFLVPAFALGVVFLVIFVGRVRVYEKVARQEDAQGRALLPTLADFGYKRRIFEVCNDLLLIILAYYGAFLLRFDGNQVQPYYSQFLRSLPLVTGIQIGAFLLLGLYRGLWRYTSVSDLSTVGRAVLGAWTASVVAVMFGMRLENMSRGMLITDGMLLMIGVGGTRISFRLLRSWIARYQPRPAARKVIIYGAGDAGELLVREMQNNTGLSMWPVGFLDDDPQKHGRVIHGLRVLGSLDQLAEVAGREGVEEVVISTTKLEAVRAAMLAELCQTEGLSCRRLRISLD